MERLWEVLPGSPYFATPQHLLVTVIIILVGAMLAFVMVGEECWAGWGPRVQLCRGLDVLLLSRNPPSLPCPVRPSCGQVWAEFNVIKETSALTFMVAGIIKEVLTGDLSPQDLQLLQPFHP